MKRLTNRTRLGLVMTTALMLAGCGTSAPANVAGLRNVVGTDLIGAVGATDKDQRKIDRTVVGICAASIWAKAECAEHGRISREGAQ